MKGALAVTSRQSTSNDSKRSMARIQRAGLPSRNESDSWEPSGSKWHRNSTFKHGRASLASADQSAYHLLVALRATDGQRTGAECVRRRNLGTVLDRVAGEDGLEGEDAAAGC